MGKHNPVDRLLAFYNRGGRTDYSDRIKPSSDGQGWHVETDRDRRGAPSKSDNYERDTNNG